MDAVDRRRQEVQAKLRGMIREAVRTKLGLLNEGVKVVEAGRSLQVTAKDGQILATTTTDVKDEVMLTVDVFDPTAPDVMIMSWNAEKTRKAYPVGEFVFKHSTPGVALGIKPNKTYSMSAGFGTFVNSRSVVKKTLVAEFELEESTAPAAATARAVAAAPPAAAAAPPAATTPAAATPPAATTVTPQQASMSVQDKIKKGAQAIAGANYDDKVTDPIDIDTVAAQNVMPGHVWVKNEDRSKYKLNDWSTGKGYDDKYTYYALVSDVTDLPVAFVVASDPEDNDHYSTGRFIGPNSRQLNLRKAFCVLYHRATGEVHKSCDDGLTPGSEDDVPGGGRGGKSKGGGAGKGGSAGTSAEGLGAERIVGKGEAAKRGRGDPSKGPLGLTRPAEKLRKNGTVFITKSLTKKGFTGFPTGPVSLKAVLSIRVKFKYPMGIESDAEGYNPRVKFGRNKGPDDIVMIQLSSAWGTVWAAHGNKLKPGEEGFDAAAKWVFANPKQFDLAPDGSTIEDSDSSTAAASTAVSPTKNAGESISEGHRRPSLMDLYRF